MLPMPEQPTPPATEPGKSVSPSGSPVHAGNKPPAVAFFNVHLSALRGSVLFLAFLAVQLLLFVSLLNFPNSRFLPAPRSGSAVAGAVAEAAACNTELVYVYDLPPEFNRDLIAGCEGLWPWYSFCPYLSNAGFGRPAAAATGFSSIIPQGLLPHWYTTDQFALEVIVHRRLLSHRCRTTDPSRATAFYVPFYAGLAVGSHLWGTNSTAADRDRDCIKLLQWLQNQTFFKKSHGWDHFITLGRITWDFRRYGDDGWGSSFVLMPVMANVTRLVIEGDRLDTMDVRIPYPTGFHPRSETDVRAWQQFVMGRTRTKLFGFAGAPRAGFKDDFRGVLLEECEDAGSACRSVDCRGTKCTDNSAAVMELFLDSVFCLQPRGDSFTRRSMFDCMVAGAVPVLFWRRSAYDQYGWYLPARDGEEKEWSVFIDRRELRVGNVSVREVLEGFTEERVRRMRERVVEMIPRLVYGSAADGLGDGMEDALDIALEGVLKRFRRHRWSMVHEERPPGPTISERGSRGKSAAPSPDFRKIGPATSLHASQGESRAPTSHSGKPGLSTSSSISRIF